MYYTILSNSESEIKKKTHFSLHLIGACSSRVTSREINLISQSDKFNITM